MKIVKIVMATAADELKNERHELGDYIRTLNDHYHNKGIYFRLANLLDFDTDEDQQREVCESEFFYIIFSDEADDGIVKKFDVALEHFKEKNTPRIYTYFQKLPDSADATDSVRNFMEKLDKEIGHYYSIFLHLDSIKLNMLLELTRSQMLKGEVNVKEGKALIDGREVLSLENVPLFQNDKELQNLLDELNVLREKQNELTAEYNQNTENLIARKHLFETIGQIKTITEQLHQKEKEMLSLCSTIAERNSSGKPLTWREKEASRYLDEGDYNHALAILRDANRTLELNQSETIAETGFERITGFINEDRLRIEILKAKGVNTNTLPEIYECYEECKTLIKKYKLETDVFYDYISFLCLQQKHEEALNNARWLLKYYDLEENIEPVKRAKLFHMMGVILQGNNQLQKAQKWYTKAIDIWNNLETDKALISKRGLAVTYSNLGSVLHIMCRYNEAKEFFNKAIKIQEDLLTGIGTGEGKEVELYETDFTRLADLCNDYGVHLYEMECYQESETELNNSLDIYKKLAILHPGDYDADFSACYNNLGNLYSRIGCFEKAEQMIFKAIEIRKKLVKVNPYAYEKELAVSFHNLGDHYLRIEQYKKSEEAYNNAITIRKKLISDRPDSFVHKNVLASVYGNLGLVFFNTEQYQKAEETWNNALHIAKEYAQEDPAAWQEISALLYYYFGELYQKTERYKEAQASLKKALRVSTKIGRTNWVKTIKESLKKLKK